MYLCLKRQETGEQIVNSTKVVWTLAPELQAHPSACYPYDYYLSIYTHWAPLLTQPIAGYWLGHTIMEALQRELYYNTPPHTHTAMPVLCCMVLLLSWARVCTTPKTQERSVSKGRLCPWVQAPGPWAAMGTVCKQHGFYVKTPRLSLPNTQWDLYACRSQDSSITCKNKEKDRRKKKKNMKSRT